MWVESLCTISLVAVVLAFLERNIFFGHECEDTLCLSCGVISFGALEPALRFLEPVLYFCTGSGAREGESLNGLASFINR